MVVSGEFVEQLLKTQILTGLKRLRSAPERRLTQRILLGKLAGSHKTSATASG